MSSSSINQDEFRIPLEEIKRATNEFDSENQIGEGGFGQVYKGQLSENWQNRTVAIKRKDMESKQGENEFLKEVLVISISHQNIIPFIGYCDEDNEMIIVYEYASNGSLHDYLRDHEKKPFLTWEYRLKICLGVAKGLKHLHSGLEDAIIHRDLKSSNILLDENMNAKISDFGLSRAGPKDQAEIYTRVAGTQYYTDPAYIESDILTIESDVYSFGIILFEVLSGIPIYWPKIIEDNTSNVMIHLVRRYSDDNNWENLIDPRIIDQVKKTSVTAFKQIAYKCINLDRNERPTMDQIINAIKEAMDFQTKDNKEETDQVKVDERKLLPTEYEYQPPSITSLRALTLRDTITGDSHSMINYYDEWRVRPDTERKVMHRSDRIDKPMSMPYSRGYYNVASHVRVDDRPMSMSYSRGDYNVTSPVRVVKKD